MGSGRLEHRSVSPWGLELIRRQRRGPMGGEPYELEESPPWKAFAKAPGYAPLTQVIGLLPRIVLSLPCNRD